MFTPTMFSRRRESNNLSTGYGLRFSTDIHVSKQEKTVFYKGLQTFVLFLQKSPKTSGNLREFMGTCNLGILSSSSLVELYRCNGRFHTQDPLLTSRRHQIDIRPMSLLRLSLLRFIDSPMPGSSLRA